MALNLEDLPFSLHANDIVKHIINIDSRFRVPQEGSDASKFYFRLPTPIRNVLRIRVTSIEFANNYFIFSAYRRNVTFWVSFDFPLVTAAVVIPDGNYTVDGLVDTINGLLAGSALSWLSVTFNAITGEFIFTGNQSFCLKTVCSEGDTWDRPYDYGLGYNLGFSRGFFASTDISGGTLFQVISNQSAYFAGDPYVFLKVNDFDCVRQTVHGGYQFTALAKIILSQSKDYMNFDDYTGHHAKEVTFPNPYDLTRFKIQLLDPYGQLLEMDSSQISFSLEVLEVRNLSLYNTIRDAFATRWTR
jgi:hypothetical protein